MVDITPDSDSNPVKAVSKGVLPTSILDWKDCSLTEIAVSLLFFEGEVGDPTGGVVPFCLRYIRNGVPLRRPYSGWTHSEAENDTREQN